ncbi:MAG: mannose-1-phosphate guanylyltransferase [Fimbriimonadaceae bacterium]
MKKVAVVMAGGSGERFWPVSTVLEPKQLLRLTPSGKTLLEEAIERVAPVTGEDNVFVSTSRHLQPKLVESGIVPSERVLAEPVKRNTLGAVLWSAAQIERQMGDQVALAITTADHLISPQASFCEDVEKALDTAIATGSITIIGIPPTRPEIGYGYLETGQGSSVISFKEKPDSETAEKYLRAGNYLWNSGMFIMTLTGLRETLHSVDPDLYVIYKLMVEGQDAFADLPSIAFDRAVLEKASDIKFVKGTFQWDDIGSWDSLLRTFPDEANSVVGRLTQIDSSGNVVYSTSSDVRVNLLGVRGLGVIVSNGEVVVIDLSRSQEVRDLATLAAEDQQNH